MYRLELYKKFMFLKKEMVKEYFSMLLLSMTYVGITDAVA